MTAICRNQVLEWWTSESEPPHQYRVLHINRIRHEAELFDITPQLESDDHEEPDKQGGELKEFPTAESAGRSRRKLFVTVELTDSDEIPQELSFHAVEFPLPAHVLTKEDDLTNEEKKIRDAHWKIIKPLVEGEDAELLFDRAYRGKLIEKRAKASGKKATAIYRILYQYFANGMTENALIPKLRNRGGPGKSRELKSESAKIGAPRQPGPHQSGPVRQGRNLYESDMKRFRLAYVRYLGKKKGDGGMTVNGAFDQMLQDIYKVGTIRNGTFEYFKGVDPDEFPTLRQFRYAIDTRIDPLKTLRLQTSEKQYALKHRGLGGRPRADKYGACEQYEIDSTPTRISLVSDLDTDQILGLATIYTVFDTATEMVVGGTFSWRSPSWEIAREALFNTATDKVAFCNRYGYVITEEMWPCHHIPHRLLADRQELLTDAAKQILSGGLGIKKIGIAPPGRGDYKSFVERNFGLINGRIEAESMPGAAPDGLPEPGEPNPKGKSIMTLSEFAQLYLMAIVDYNHHFLIKDGMPEDAVKDGVRPYPIALWNWSMKNSISTPQQRTQEEIYLHLLPHGKATIQRDGIYFGLPGYKKKLRYTCERAVKEQWFERARNFGRETIDVHYELGWTDYIWLRNKKGGFERGDLRDGEESARNRRFEEVLGVLEKTYTPTPQEQNAALASRLGVRQVAGELLKKGKDRVKASQSGKSSRERLAGMQEGRKLAREAERGQRNLHMAKILNLPKSATTTDTDAKPDTKDSTKNTLDLFRRARDKALGGEN